MAGEKVVAGLKKQLIVILSLNGPKEFVSLSTGLNVNKLTLHSDILKNIFPCLDNTRVFSMCLSADGW